jgi:hypothetical protein
MPVCVAPSIFILYQVVHMDADVGTRCVGSVLSHQLWRVSAPLPPKHEQLKMIVNELVIVVMMMLIVSLTVISGLMLTSHVPLAFGLQFMTVIIIGGQLLSD